MRVKFTILGQKIYIKNLQQIGKKSKKSKNFKNQIRQNLLYFIKSSKSNFFDECQVVKREKTQKKARKKQLHSKNSINKNL